jgi:hypothetical protein
MNNGKINRCLKQNQTIVRTNTPSGDPLGVAIIPVIMRKRIPYMNHVRG